MSFIAEEISGQFWGDDKPFEQGVQFPIGLENSGTIDAIIESIYVVNIITNPQETKNIYNFAFNIPYKLFDFSGLSNPNFDGFAMNIPYPSYYSFVPGNRDYIGYGLGSDASNFKFPTKFTLGGGETLRFVLRFTPLIRKVDFYKSKLVVKYRYNPNDSIKTISHDIRTTYYYPIDEVDHKRTLDEIFSISGIPLGGLITVQ